MKRKGLSGWGRVFGFTLRQIVARRGWLTTTLLPAVLLLAAIPAAMLLVEQTSQKAPTQTPITQVIVADETAGKVDYALLNELGDPLFHNITYTAADTPQAALSLAAGRETALVLAVSRDESAYRLQLIRPDGTALKGKDASAYESFLERSFSAITVQKSGIDPTVLLALSQPITSEGTTSDAYYNEDLSSGYNQVQELVESILPYAALMLMYFLVLIYGSSVAGSVVLEKTSKLMDTMLLSLQPAAMILGKLLAVALAGVVQLGVWVGGAALGCMLGRQAVLAISPYSDMAMLRFLGSMGSVSGLFSGGAVAVAVGVIVAGFLMYCAIAAISGALASKQEDLSSTNTIFTMLLVVSFLISFFSRSSSSTSMVSDAVWLNYVPFTAILCVPARAVLGQISLTTGLLSLALIVITMLAAVLLAGKLYSLTTFRRGDPLKPSDIPRLLKSGKD